MVGRWWVWSRRGLVDWCWLGLVVSGDKVVVSGVGFAGLSASLSVKEGIGAESAVFIGVALGVVCGDAASSSVLSRSPSLVADENPFEVFFSLILSFWLVTSSVCCSPLV